MKSLTISRSRDVIISLRLAGIEGVYCKNESELKTKFKQYKEDGNVGIIILIEDDFKLIEEEVIEVKLSKKLPLVVTIPDRNGLKDKDFIMRYIKESVGVKVNWWGINMILLENKLDIFEKIVFLDKEKECLEKLVEEKSKVQKDLEDKEKELDGVKAEIIARRVNLANRQKYEMISEVNENSRILELQKDEELLSKLIEELYKKVLSFVETDEYLNFVVNKFKGAVCDLKQGKYIVGILDEDREKLSKKLIKIAEDKNLELEYEKLPTQYLGGFTISDYNKTYTIDGSFKTMIEESRYDIGKLLHSTLKKAGGEIWKKAI